MEVGELVYFFFRETAIETLNCGKVRITTDLFCVTFVRAANVCVAIIMASI